jgi:YbgC/YbaW family acyl-CoA thioester hydrolase
MPRVKLTELPSYEFQHHLTVRMTDINYAGHLGNEALLGLVHEARAKFLQHLKFNTVASTGQRTGIIIADLVVNFQAEAFADDQLTIDCQIDEIGERSFRLFHRIRREQQTIALVETGAVCFDFLAGEVIHLPQDFLNELQNFRDTLRDSLTK